MVEVVVVLVLVVMVEVVVKLQVFPQHTILCYLSLHNHTVLPINQQVASFTYCKGNLETVMTMVRATVLSLSALARVTHLRQCVVWRYLATPSCYC